MAKKGLGPAKRFGPRYGRTVKHKFAKIEIEQKKKQTCLYCSRKQVSRIAAGIWKCAKCSAVFTGRAYTVGARTIFGEKAVKIVAEVPELRFKSKVEEDI
ncbi:50S ribosomal protein L37ae [Candidatus Woesearchaeota archaeon CG10_big_fil_rev_8_21_14_0_10_37_12]|nr:MAG: 50S ribosomal protein L37ae [Candidatus Woesearchaeota archaeon CG10_big_fil_rev_8_21_14_0_10_37_12]